MSVQGKDGITEMELAKRYREVFEAAPRGDKMFAVRFFGIRYSEEIDKLNEEEKGVIRRIAKNSRLEKNHSGKMHLGIKLGRFVEIKKCPDWWPKGR